MINPQRWNMYAYAVNNPYLYVDPSGRDAIVADFSNKSMGFGHLRVMSVQDDGTVMYGDFAPQTQHMPIGPGAYDVFTLNSKIVFDSLGFPTQGSLAAVTAEIAKHQKEPTPVSSITLDYFKTSAAETAALSQYLKNAAKHSAPEKRLGTN